MLKDDNMCFVCGTDNPIGLKMPFRLEGDECVMEFTPERAHEGWAQMLHGGLAATLLDEAMSRVCWEMGVPAVSAEMQVRWRKPVPIGRKTVIRGRIERRRGRLVHASARMLLDDGTEAVVATGKLVRVDDA